MALNVDDLLKDWGERLFYRIPRKARRCKTITGTLARSKAGPATQQLRSPRVVKATIHAAARKAPEVMVKISGAGKGMRQIRAHMEYISRNGQLVLEDQDGELISGKQAVRDLALEWQHGLFGIPEEGRRREAFNIVLSMPPGTNREAVRLAASEFGRKLFGDERPYVFVAHDDEKHPHVHLCVKSLGLDGKRLNPRKADLQLWREQFADALRGHGIAACATPRHARGTRQRTTSQARYHRGHRGSALPSPHKPFPSERAQLSTYAVVAKQLATLEGEGSALALDLVRTAARMPGTRRPPEIAVPAKRTRGPVIKQRDRTSDRDR